MASACGSAPEAPDWQLDAHASMQQAVAAQLTGDDRIADAAHARARAALARTGRAEWVARAELTRCAVRLASLQFGPCAAFEPLRADSPAAEQAYADLLAGPVEPARRVLLPAAQQAAVAARGDGPGREAAIRAIEDPVSRLLAAALALRDGDATPSTVAVAVQTASQQGWRRPLLAWLGVARQRAEAAGDGPATAALQRRIDLVTASPSSGSLSPSPASGGR